MDVYTTEYFTVAVYVALAVICLLGNTWVIVTVLRQFFGCFTTNYSYLHTLKPAIYSASVYLLLLSIVDLISILPVPVLVVDILNNDFPFQPNLLGRTVCKLIFFCEGANKSLSPLVLTVLSIDRYVAVCRPGWICLRRPKVACFMLLICFLLSLCFVAPVTSVAMIGPMVDEKNRSHSKCYLEELPLSWKFDIFHILGCYILPLIIICSVYASILRRLYRHAHSSTVGSKTSIPLHRVVKCSAAVVGFYFICWTPYWTIRMGYINDEYQCAQNITTSMENGTSAEETEAALAAERMSWTKVLSIYFFHSLPYAQSAFNWLFYAFLNRNLRNASSRPSASGRSNGVTSVLIDHQNTTSPNGNYTSSWKSQKASNGVGFGARKSKLNLRLEVPLRSTRSNGGPNTLLNDDTISNNNVNNDEDSDGVKCSVGVGSRSAARKASSVKFSSPSTWNINKLCQMFNFRTMQKERPKSVHHYRQSSSALLREHTMRAFAINNGGLPLLQPNFGSEQRQPSNAGPSEGSSSVEWL